MNSNVPNWAEVQPVGGERRMPVYLLLDTSGSMEGAAIEAVRQGLEQFQHELSSDQFARDVAAVAIITFNGDARIETNGLVPISQFSPPNLVASGATRLDLAFKKLVESMDRDVLKPVKGGQKGDWKPAVFILTDGQPTDANGNFTDALWRPARDAVTSRAKGMTKPSTIVSCGCGPNCDDATLKEISTGTAFRIDSSAAAFVSLFGYLSQSISNSMQPGGNTDDPFANMDLPDDLVRIP